MSRMSMKYFKTAIIDYRYLLNRDYPEKASLKLVGDRYRLTKLERNCLFRGIVKSRIAGERKKKIVRIKNLAHQPMGIDWYNVLITVESYLKGVPIFLSDDGLVRDSAGIHGSYRRSKVTERAISEIWQAILRLAPSRVDVYLDSPVSHSGEMANRLRERLQRIGVKNFNVEIIQSADYPLKSYEGTVASSDSVILDNAERIFDLSRYVLKRAFSFRPKRIEELGDVNTPDDVNMPG